MPKVSAEPNEVASLLLLVPGAWRAVISREKRADTIRGRGQTVLCRPRGENPTRAAYSSTAQLLLLLSRRSIGLPIPSGFTTCGYSVLRVTRRLPYVGTNNQRFSYRRLRMLVDTCGTETEYV